MNKQCLVDAGAYTALGCVSIFCGSAYYVNFVQTPAMMAVKDTKAVRDLWKEMFLRAKVYQVRHYTGADQTLIIILYTCLVRERGVTLARIKCKCPKYYLPFIHKGWLHWGRLNAQIPNITFLVHIEGKVYWGGSKAQITENSTCRRGGFMERLTVR